MNLADFIQQDLKARILSGKGAPKKLTLMGISELYDVSITPVRIAVSKLINEGIICKQANGRLALNPERNRRVDGTEVKKICRPLSSADWGRLMLNEIMYASLKPAGRLSARRGDGSEAQHRSLCHPRHTEPSCNSGPARTCAASRLAGFTGSGRKGPCLSPGT